MILRHKSQRVYICMRGEPQDTDRGQQTCRYMWIQWKQTQSEYMDRSETQSQDTNAGAGTEADEAESLWMCEVWQFWRCCTCSACVGLTACCWVAIQVASPAASSGQLLVLAIYRWSILTWHHWECQVREEEGRFQILCTAHILQCSPRLFSIVLDLAGMILKMHIFDVQEHSKCLQFSSMQITDIPSLVLQTQPSW